MNFVECHEQKTGAKVLLPLEKINAIIQEKDLRAYIETYYDPVNDESVGFYTKELYAELKMQIAKAG